MEYAINFEGITLKEKDKFVGSLTASRRGEATYSILKVFVEEEFRGQSLAGELMKQYLAFAKENNFKVTPICSYATSFLERYKKEYADLIA